MSNENHELIQTMFPPDGSEVKPYEWMINPTRQQQWIDKQGIFLWLAFFFSEIGAGLYFISLFYGYTPGLVLGWLITLVLGGLIHVAYLGNPLRAWRMLMKPNTSELSRGIWVIGAFAVFGFLQMTVGGFNIFFNILMGILCLLIISHGFATMNVIRALPAWSSNMVLPFSIISGVWVGQQILQFIFGFSAAMESVQAGMEVWAEVFFFAYFLCLVLYVWGTWHSDEVGAASIKMMVKDDRKMITLVGVVGLAVVIPLILTLIMWGSEQVNDFLVLLRLASVFAGDLAVRYVVMKSAVYKPLLERG